MYEHFIFEENDITYKISLSLPSKSNVTIKAKKNNNEWRTDILKIYSGSSDDLWNNRSIVYTAEQIYDILRDYSKKQLDPAIQITLPNCYTDLKNKGVKNESPQICIDVIILKKNWHENNKIYSTYIDLPLINGDIANGKSYANIHLCDSMYDKFDAFLCVDVGAPLFLACVTVSGLLLGYICKNYYNR